jgi:thiamine-monophosphate kinase
MRVSELGEFGLIERISRFLPSPPSDVFVGIGDDVAVLKTDGPEFLLATCDAQIENVHFTRQGISAYQLGRKIVAINVSDIAAKGGSPAWALVSLGLPPDTDVGFVDGLYEGMQEQIAKAGAAIVGGNLSKIREEVMVDLFLLGRVGSKDLVLRNGAREGDLVLVTGTLGDSRAGLELLRNPGLKVPDPSRSHVMERHLTPRPRLAEGRLLARSGMVHAMADVSDGLAGDLRHICRASEVGSVIHWADLPVSGQCEQVAHAAGQKSRQWALTGGEDYELLFTADPKAAPEIQKILLAETGTQARVIGRILPKSESIKVRMDSGEEVSCSKGGMGWDHFSAS